MATLEFFVYNHEEREFTYFDGDQTRLEEVMTADNPDEISEELDGEGIDGMLVLDEDGGRWYLAFSASLGIVGQRTARRQADTIVRSGFTLPDGYWLKANYPMEELNDPNIGDLWQTVQQKYVKDHSLTGLELDETGIPKQIAERAKEMEKAGVKDALAEAKLEYEEAEERNKAMARSQGKPRKKKSRKKAAKKIEKSKPAEKKPAKKKSTKKKVSKKSDGVEEDPYFMEVGELAEYVHNNYTRIVSKGPLTDSEGNTTKENVIFDQARIPKSAWNDVVIYLEEEDMLELTIEKTDDEIFALSVKK